MPYGDVAALAAAVTDATAMVILEPIQGENGVVVPPPGYLAAARRITARHGALLVLDEVQTGIGRTGHWFAHQADGVEPDVVTLAKGLGGGLPLGACLAFGRAADLLSPGSHGTTFGGNPVSCAAALAVVAHHRRRGPARPRQAGRRAAAPRASRRWTTRWSPASAAPACCSASCSTAPVGGRCRRRRCARPASWSTRSSRT